MNERDYVGLKVGDLVRHKMSGSAMVVVEVVGGVPVVARYTSISNPHEWDRVDPDGKVVSS